MAVVAIPWQATLATQTKLSDESIILCPLPYLGSILLGLFYPKLRGLHCTMAPISIADIVSSLPVEDTWGPATSSDNMLDGVPYAPFSKGDKLGRMADWTAESKDRERAGRQAYNRNYRGTTLE